MTVFLPRRKSAEAFLILSLQSFRSTLKRHLLFSQLSLDLLEKKVFFLLIMGYLWCSLLQWIIFKNCNNCTCNYNLFYGFFFNSNPHNTKFTLYVTLKKSIGIILLSKYWYSWLVFLSKVIYKELAVVPVTRCTQRCMGFLVF